MTRKENNMKENGGPAFPQNDATVNRINNLDGMSLRDYFAGQALSGSMACQMGFDGNNDIKSVCMTAKMCYEFADEMLKQRSL